MKTKLDISLIQYLNTFEKITRVKTRHCFIYNSSIIFLVPKKQTSKVIGRRGINVKKLNNLLNKKIKIIEAPLTIDDVENFITSLIFPIKLKKILVDKEKKTLTIMAGPQAKAQLIGRDKSKYNQLKKILEEYFNIKNLRII